MATGLPLPERLLPLLDGAVSLLAGLVPVEQVLLGGGTALAARWRHRDSVDINLFVDPVAYRTGVYRPRAECERRLKGLGLGRLAVLGEDGMGFFHRGGKVDVIGCYPVTDGSRSGDLVPGRRVRLETTVEILAKKLHRRILGQGVILPRDLYDMAYARRFDPGSLQAAWSASPAPDLEALVAALSSFCPGWMARQEHPVDGARHPDLVTGAVEGLLSDARSRLLGCTATCLD